MSEYLFLRDDLVVDCFGYLFFLRNLFFNDSLTFYSYHFLPVGSFHILHFSVAILCVHPTLFLLSDCDSMYSIHGMWKNDVIRESSL